MKIKTALYFAFWFWLLCAVPAVVLIILLFSCIVIVWKSTNRGETLKRMGIAFVAALAFCIVLSVPFAYFFSPAWPKALGHLSIRSGFFIATLYGAEHVRQLLEATVTMTPACSGITGQLVGHSELRSG